MKKLITFLLLLSPFAKAHAAGESLPSGLEYVKLTLRSADKNMTADSNICGGVLIAKNLVLTASHCIEEKWISAPYKDVIFYYGKDFSSSASLLGKTTWVKFDPDVDLAIIKMNKSAPDESDAKIAELDAYCPGGPTVPYPVKARFYERMDVSGEVLGRETWTSRQGEINGDGKSPLANGHYYVTNQIYFRPGDSGSPVFSSRNILVAIANGQYDGKGYATTLCLYRKKIDAEMKKLDLAG